jgi:hypothetical protein
MNACVNACNKKPTKKTFSDWRESFFVVLALLVVSLDIQDEQDADNDDNADQTAGNPINRFLIDLLFFFAQNRIWFFQLHRGPAFRNEYDLIIYQMRKIDKKHLFDYTDYVSLERLRT